MVEVQLKQGIGLNGIWEGKEMAVGNSEREKESLYKHLHWYVAELDGENVEKILDTEAWDVYKNI